MPIAKNIGINNKGLSTEALMALMAQRQKNKLRVKMRYMLFHIGKYIECYDKPKILPF